MRVFVQQYYNNMAYNNNIKRLRRGVLHLRSVLSLFRVRDAPYIVFRRRERPVCFARSASIYQIGKESRRSLRNSRNRALLSTNCMRDAEIAENTALARDFMTS